MTARPPIIDIIALEAEAKERLYKTLPDNKEWFVETAGILLQQEIASTDQKLVIEAHRLCVRYFYTSRDRQLAIMVAEHALEIAVSAALGSEERSVCNWIGVLHKVSGKFVLAMQFFVRGIRVARRIEDHEGEANIWANMASLADAMCLYDDAIKFAQRAIAILANLETETAKHVHGDAMQIVARAFHASGRFEEALVAIRQAAQLQPTAKSAFDYLMRVRMQHTHTVIALRLNELDEAKSAANAAAQDAEHCGGTDAAVHSLIAKAMVDARTGNHASADATTKRLLKDYATESNLVHDLYTARLYVLEQANRTEEADALRRRFRDDWQKQKMKDVISQLRTLDQTQSGEQENSQAAARAHLEELAIIGELHDDATGERAFRVGRLVSLLARRLGRSEEEADQLDRAARLLDIGKITTPPEMLTKAGRLSANEWKVIQQHTEQGYIILSTRRDPLMELAAEIALHHHERWDGKGYPEKLKGKKIPLAAQMASLADVFDALTHVRAYRPAWRIEAALGEIERLSRAYGEQHFETALADEFIGMVRALTAEHGEEGLDTFLSARSLDSAFYNARVAANDTLESVQIDVLERLAVAAELRDDGVSQSGLRVGRLASLLAGEMGYADEQIESIEFAARMRDIGKSIMPDNLLFKPRRYSQGEREVMQMHTVMGADLLAKSSLPAIRMAGEVARHHHERWDGTGYPDKLSGRDIPEHARITSLADTFDALTRERPHQPARSAREALAEIKSHSGTQFDPDLAGHFVRMVDKLIAQHGDNLEPFLLQKSPPSLQPKRPFLLDDANLMRGTVNRSGVTLTGNARNAHRTAGALPANDENNTERWSGGEVAANAKQIKHRLKQLSQAGPSDAAVTSTLTASEREVFNWVRQGKTNPEVAQILGLSKFTVKTHLQRIFSKTGVNSRVALARLNVYED
jgi:putative two-component system response regulator